MDVDYGAGRFWLSAVQWVTTLAVGVYAWWTARNRATAKSIADVKNQVDGVDGRVLLLEDRAKSAPTHDDLGKLYERLGQINGNVERLVGEFSAHRRSVDRIQEHLLNRSDKS